MDINSLPNRTYSSSDDEGDIAEPNMVLTIIVLCIAGPFWLLLSLLRGTLKKDIVSARHAAQNK